jgi:hypothetical protein
MIVEFNSNEIGHITISSIINSHTMYFITKKDAAAIAAKLIITLKTKIMRKQYIIRILICKLLGYISIGGTITSIIIILCGQGSSFSTLLFIFGSVFAILLVCLEQHYQDKVNKIDFDDLPF